MSHHISICSIRINTPQFNQRQNIMNEKEETVLHFEGLWEIAEEIGLQRNPEGLLKEDVTAVGEALAELQTASKNGMLQDPDNEIIFGRALFHFCGIAQKLNINSYMALIDYIQSLKQEELDETEEELKILS